jgi:hypothetical protein
MLVLQMLQPKKPGMRKQEQKRQERRKLAQQRQERRMLGLRMLGQQKLVGWML